MSVSYRHKPLLRWPAYLPIHGETYLQSVHRLRHLVDLWKRVDYVKSKVDDGPIRCEHSMRSKLKKLLVFGQQIARIEQGNRFMMRLILTIMKGPAAVDHYHKRPLGTHISSLNFVGRRMAVNRINTENKEMLKRIMRTRTSYDHVEQELDYQKRMRPKDQFAQMMKMWHELAEERKWTIANGMSMVRREFDYEGLKARLDAKHRLCIPTGRFEKIQPLPVPRSSRSPTGARPTDHQRCFTTAPILPPIRPRRQATGRWAAEASIQLRETKTIKLRKNKLQLKLEALKPKPPITRSRSPPYLLKEGEVQAVPVKADDATANKGKAIRTEKGKRVRWNEPGHAAQDGAHKGGINKNFNRSAELPTLPFSSSLPSSARKRNENVNQCAAVPSARFSSRFSGQSSPCYRPIILDKLLPNVPTTAGVNAADRKIWGEFEKAKKHPYDQEAKRPPRLKPLPSSLRKDLNGPEKAFRGASRVSEIACSAPIDKPTPPGQNTKKARKGEKKKQCVIILPEIRRSSGKITSPPLHAAEFLGNRFRKVDNGLSSKVLHQDEQKIKRISKKVGRADLEKEVLRGTMGTSKSAGITSSANQAFQGKGTEKTEMDGVNKRLHAAEDSYELTSELSSTKRSVVGSALGSAAARESDHEEGSRLEDNRPRSRDVQLEGRLESQASDVQPEDGLESQTSGVQLMERLESQTSGVQLMERLESQTSGVQLMERLESQTSDVQPEDGLESQTSGVQMMDRPTSQISDVQLEDRPESQTSYVQLVDRPMSQTSDVQLENRSEDQTSGVQLMDRPMPQTSNGQLDDRPESQTSGVQLVERLESQSSGVQLEDRLESQTSGVQFEDWPESQTSGVQLEESPKSQISDVQVEDRPESQTSGVQLEESPKSQISDVQVEDRPESQTSDVQLVDRPMSQTSDVQVEDRPKSLTSDVQLEDRPESPTSDVQESRSSDNDDLSVVSVRSIHSFYSLDDGGNTTDDAEDLPESDSEDLSLNRLSQR